MQLTQTDTRLLNSAIRSLGGNVSFIGSGALSVQQDHAYEIIALRYTIWSHRRSLSSSSGPVAQYQLLLCKMTHMYPESAHQYLMGSNLSAALMRDSRIQCLYNKYVSQARSSGAPYGSWALNAHEQVIYGLYYHNAGNGPLIVNTQHLRSLISAYDAQVQAAESAEARKTTSVRSKLMDMQESTATERKALALDGKGKCFGCDAVKPRGVVCSVCGYRPRSASMK